MTHHTMIYIYIYINTFLDDGGAPLVLVAPGLQPTRNPDPEYTTNWSI